MDNKNSNSYKWVLLALVVCSIAGVSYTQFQITASTMVPVLFQTLGIGVAQFSALTTAAMLVGVVFAIIGGVIADKIGPKKTCTIALALSLVGAVLRINASTYGMYFLAMFLIGFGGSFLSMCSAKLFAAWFAPAEMAVAMGCMMAAGSFGSFITNATTNALFNGNLKAASTVGSVVIAVMLLLWVLFLKEKPAGAPDFPPMPVLEPLKKALKSKNVWIIGLAAAFAMGFQMVLNVNYQNALATAKAATPAMCSLYSTILTIGGALGSIAVPGICAKLGKNRPSVLLFSVLGAVLVYAGWAFCDGIVMALLIAVGAFLGFGAIPVIMGYPALLEEIGPMNAGSAAGLITTIQMAGAFFLPSYVLAPMATNANGTNFTTLILYGCVCAVLTGVFAFLLPELGTKALAEKASK
ncbi:MAG: MFS transporter [Eubacteriaceae bacterium]|nr:MFS transporter [Eubacteriaceae bacterium]